MDAETNKHLHDQLIKLGDMMGDGLHHEPDGRWITKEYHRVAKALGYIPKAKRNTKVIDEKMKDRVRDVPCSKCGGDLKQTRSGSMRASCLGCGARFQLLRKRTKR